MRPRLPLALVLLAATRLTAAEVCEPTTQTERQFRTEMKHRAPGPRAGTAATVAELAAWPPAADVTRVDVRRRDVAIDPREQRAVVLTGDLWRVKVEDNDCDLHLEVAATGGTAESPRVIAEVPGGPGYEAARAAVLAAIHLPSARARDRVDLATPVRVRLTGVRLLGQRALVSARWGARVRPRDADGRDALGAPPGVAGRSRGGNAADASSRARSARGANRAAGGGDRGPGGVLRRLDVAVRVRAPVGDGLLPGASGGVRRVPRQSLSQQQNSRCSSPCGSAGGRLTMPGRCRPHP